MKISDISIEKAFAGFSDRLKIWKIKIGAEKCEKLTKYPADLWSVIKLSY